MIRLVNKRSDKITTAHINKIAKVYNGKSMIHVSPQESLKDQKFGVLVITKKLGKAIHNSERNRKRKAKKTTKK